MLLLIYLVLLFGLLCADICSSWTCSVCKKGFLTQKSVKDRPNKEFDFVNETNCVKAGPAVCTISTPATMCQAILFFLYDCAEHLLKKLC